MWEKYYSSQVNIGTNCNNSSRNSFIKYCQYRLSILNAEAAKERIRYEAEQNKLMAIAKTKEARIQKEKEWQEKQKEKQEKFEVDLEVEYEFSSYLIGILQKGQDEADKLEKQMKTYYDSRQLKQLIDSNKFFIATIKKNKPDKYEAYGVEMSLYNQIDVYKSNLEFTIRKNRKNEFSSGEESPQQCKTAYYNLRSIAEARGFSPSGEFDLSHCSEYIKTYELIKENSTNP